MTSRYLLVAVFFISLISGAAAKEKKAKSIPAERTWKDLQDRAMKIGSEWPIKPPMSRNLGYTQDEVPAKGISLDQKDSKDNRSHTIVIAYAIDKHGDAKPVEMIVGSIRVTEVKDGKIADSYRLRMTLAGERIKMMHASGLVGHIIQEEVPLNSKSAQDFYKSEKKLLLSDLDINQLTP